LDCVEEVKQLRQEKKASREATLAKKENKRKQLIQIYLTENGVPQQVVEDIYVQLKKYRYRDFIQNKP
jgi:pimeloyl-CoA synthetase